jgi:L-amino acid N-acyltransferase YncA
MGTINTSFLTSAERMHEWYDKSLDFKEHAAFVVVSQGDIIGVVHAFQTGASNTYEVSFSRRSDLEGEGIGIHLMRILIDWASASGVESLHAITFRTYKSPMLELFKKFKFRITSDPEDRRNAKCDATVEDLKVTCQQVETE